MLRGWEKLICPFFSSACRRVLKPYLERNGIVESGLTEIGGLRYSRFGVFLEISYELELVPYALRMVLGAGDKKYDNAGRLCCVPYWYLLPQDRPERRGESTRFSTEAELELLLIHFRDRFLEPYAKPLWIDIGALEASIVRFNASLNQSPS